MPTISKTLSDEKAQRITNGLCALHGYKEKIPNPEEPTEENAETYEATIDNPESRDAFAKRKIWETAARDARRGEELLARQAVQSPSALEL